MVKLSVVFKGRQMRHTEFGPQLLGRILGIIEGIGQHDREPRWEGRRFVSILKPTKETVQKAAQEHKAKEKQQEENKRIEDNEDSKSNKENGESRDQPAEN